VIAVMPSGSATSVADRSESLMRNAHGNALLTNTWRGGRPDLRGWARSFGKPETEWREPSATPVSLRVQHGESLITKVAAHRQRCSRSSMRCNHEFKWRPRRSVRGRSSCIRSTGRRVPIWNSIRAMNQRREAFLKRRSARQSLQPCRSSPGQPAAVRSAAPGKGQWECSGRSSRFPVHEYCLAKRVNTSPASENGDLSITSAR